MLFGEAIASDKRRVGLTARETSTATVHRGNQHRLPVRWMTVTSNRVLVIDDESPIRKLLRMGLSTQGYKVVEASNGTTALNLLSQKLDLIILDLGLPDMHGFELLRRIRSYDDNVPIMVLSGRGEETCKVEALDLGAYDYVTKPFGMNELFARMRAARRHKLQVNGERPVFRSGELSVDLVRRLVKVGETEIKLTPKPTTCFVFSCNTPGRF